MRPLPKKLLEAATKNTVYLLRLQQVLLVEMLAEFKAAVGIYLNYVSGTVKDVEKCRVSAKFFFSQPACHSMFHLIASLEVPLFTFLSWLIEACPKNIFFSTCLPFYLKSLGGGENSIPYLFPIFHQVNSHLLPIAFTYIDKYVKNQQHSYERQDPQCFNRKGFRENNVAVPNNTVVFSHDSPWHKQRQSLGKECKYVFLDPMKNRA